MNDANEFQHLVQQHIAWVYSCARRLTPGNADAVTVAVFLLLHDQFQRLSANDVVDWLFRATLACAGVGRRAVSPQKSVRDRIDETVAKLGKSDREVIFNRFYQPKTTPQFAVAMRVSEDSAKRRIYKAIDKVQERLAKIGIEAAPAAIVETLSVQFTQSAPTGLLDSVLKEIQKPAGAESPARAIANGAGASMAFARVRKAAIVAGVLFLCVVASAIALWHFSNQAQTSVRDNHVVAAAKTAATAPATKPAAPPIAPDALRVGVYLSKFTGDRVGYSCQMTDELLRRGLDVSPILDPGTEADPKIARLSGIYFIGKHAIDSTNAEALGKLDVIVAPRIWMLRDDARQAIESAVRGGTGLLIRNGLGCMDPGSGPDVSRLSGFTESEFSYDPHPLDCDVVGEHAILGKLSGKIGTAMKITPNGTWGKLTPGFTPLIQVKELSSFREPGQGHDDWGFYPLYVGQLGKGRVVGCQFPAWERMPKDLMAAADNEFNLKAVIWLAGRDGGAQVAATRPAGRAP